MIRNIYVMLGVIMLVISILGGCTNAQADTDTNQTVQSSDTTSNADVDLENIEVSYTDEDEDADYDESKATSIDLTNSTVDGNGALISKNVVNITAAGTYILTGELSDGQVVVEATKVDEVTLVLDGVTITNTTGSAIYIKQAEKVYITLAEGSTNYVADGANYEDTSDDAPDSAIYAGDDLTINGSGSLTVVGNYKHAIKTVDELVVTGGTLNLTAVEEGLRGKDSVSVLDGDITISAGGDGIKSDNSEDEDRGWVSIDGGTFNIQASNNGIQGQTGLIITAGQLNISANEDTLHCNGSIKISGGEITLDAGDDGAHADNSLDVTGGQITILNSYEGLEGAEVTISGGDISINADDDGINAAGGSDGDMRAGDNFRQQKQQSSSGEYFISISGGSVYINADGDGIDSNGDIEISGGTIVVDGPTSSANSAIDMENSSFTVTGGTLSAVGASGMLVTPTDAEQPVITLIVSGDGGGEVTLSDSDGNVIISITPAKSYQSIMLSSPSLEQGETYTVTFSDGSTESVTVSSMITTAAGNTGGMGGQNNMPSGGGRGGGRP